MYNREDTIASIKATAYIKDYRDVDKFIVFCKQCESYGNCWSCPPFSFDTEIYLSGYEYVILIGTKITPDKSLLEVTDIEQNKLTGRDIISRERQKLDARLLELEKSYPASKAFFAGVCHSCGDEKCARINGEPCLHPELTRSSLESLGFDIGRTAAELLGIELKWSSNGMLPEYFMLVSGFFTNHNPQNIYFR